MYRVAPGDTVLGIARQFAVDIDDVTRQNKLDEGDKLKVGSLLRLRVRRDLVTDPAGGGAKDDDKAAPGPRGPSSRAERHPKGRRDPS